MTSEREYGAVIFSPGIQNVLLYKEKEESGWAFPFSRTTESDVHVVAAASVVRQLLGLDIGDKISRTHWIEAEFPETGALVRLYIALGIRPDSVTPRCADGAVAEWHPLSSILPPVNAILREEGGVGGTCADEEEGGSMLPVESCIAPFLAKLKALLSKHPEWRISQLDPHLMDLIQAAIALPQQPASETHHHQQNVEQGQQQEPLKQQDEEMLTQMPQEPPPAECDEQQGQLAATGSGDVLQEVLDVAEPPVYHQQQEQQQEQPSDDRREERGAVLELDETTRTEISPGEVEATLLAQPQQPQQNSEVDEKPTSPQQPGSAQLQEREEAEVEGVQLGAAAEGGLLEREGYPSAENAAGQDDRDSAKQDDAAGAGVERAFASAGSDGGEEAGGGESDGWRGPRPQEHLLEYCRQHGFPEPCYSLVVKKSARRPLVTASCILSHLGVTVTPDMHVPGGMHAACQAAALAALLWLEGALAPDGGEAVRVVPVGWPPLLSESRGESWEAAQLARRTGGSRRELDQVQKEALLREMDKKRQRLVEEAAELERLMAALRGGEAVPEPDMSKLAAELGLVSPGDGGDGEVRPSQALTLTVPEPRAPRGSKRSADGGDLSGDGTGGLAMGLRALQFRSGSNSRGGPRGAGGGGGGGGAGGGRAPGTKRPREDGTTAGGHGGDGGSGSGAAMAPNKNVVMELKEFCDRKRWPQPQYSYKPGAGPGAAAMVILPPAAGVREVSSGPQSNRKRAKEAAAAAALAQLSALGLK